MTDTPLVSAILPVYEPNEIWLKEAVESILSQTYENIELVIVNDGSSKGLTEYLSSETLDDERIQTIYQENQGFTAASNTAFRHATGEYVAPLGQDDIWNEDKIEKQIKCLGGKKKVCLTKAETIDKESNLHGYEGAVPSDERYENLKFSCYPCYESLLIKKELMESLDYLSEEFDIASDYDLWFRLFPKTKIEYIDEPLVSKRYHKENTSKASTKLLNEGGIIRRRYIDDDKMLKQVLSKFFRRNGKRFFESGNEKKAREVWLNALKHNIGYKAFLLLAFSYYKPAYNTANRIKRALPI